MHEMRGADDSSPKRLANRLMPQAHAQQRRLPGEVTNQINTDAGLVGRAWPGREDDFLRPHRFYFFDGDLVVAPHFHIRAQLSEILDQVVGKRIVIVENKNHHIGPQTPDYTSRLAVISPCPAVIIVPRMGQLLTQAWY